MYHILFGLFFGFVIWPRLRMLIIRAVVAYMHVMQSENTAVKATARTLSLAFLVTGGAFLLGCFILFSAFFWWHIQQTYFMWNHPELDLPEYTGVFSEWSRSNEIVLDTWAIGMTAIAVLAFPFALFGVLAILWRVASVVWAFVRNGVVMGFWGNPYNPPWAPRDEWDEAAALSAYEAIQASRRTRELMENAAEAEESEKWHEREYGYKVNKSSK